MQLLWLGVLAILTVPPHDTLAEENMPETLSLVLQRYGYNDLPMQALGALHTIPGQLTPIDQSEIPLEAKQFALKIIESKSSSASARKIVDIRDAKKQELAGMDYMFTLVLSETNCRKNEDLEHLNENCHVPSGAPMSSCSVDVWVGEMMLNAKGQCNDINPDSVSIPGTSALVCPGQNLNPQLDQVWSDFKQKFNKTYNSLQEECKRRGIFEANSALIERHNEDFRNGLTTYTLGINQFADQTAEELNNQHGRGFVPLTPRPKPNFRPGVRDLLRKGCDFLYNQALADEKSYYKLGPLIASSAKICQRMCQKLTSCSSWSWVEMGINAGSEVAYFDGRKRHECLLGTGDLAREDLVEAFGVVTGPKYC